MKIVLPFKAHNYYCRILFLWTKAILFPFLYCTYSTLPSHSDWGAHEPAGLLVSGLWPAGIRPMASWYQAYVLLVSGLWPAGIRPMTCWYQVMTCCYQSYDLLVSGIWPAGIRPMSCWYQAYDLLVSGPGPIVLSTVFVTTYGTTDHIKHKVFRNTVGASLLVGEYWNCLPSCLYLKNWQDKSYSKVTMRRIC